ncbi:HNH endonuclease [Magnetovirga frankeli]|uniref:HNH endonuclease n=1 Tax=Magnetovirga frankeli TaxID=947516 RepID=UPI001293D16E|nr:HNH endonuclease [gamma proteobacterium SS-5]
MHFLALDCAGNPSVWLDPESAIQLVAAERVLAGLGETVRVFQGGINARTGRRSRIAVASILLTRGKVKPHLWSKHYEPPLTNPALFRRDRHLCLYCGGRFAASALTRDHVLPKSRGGSDSWANVVSACRSCNQRKGARTPREWGTELLAVPYVPCYAEHLILGNRAILADQMAFLKARLRRMP